MRGRGRRCEKWYGETLRKGIICVVLRDRIRISTLNEFGCLTLSSLSHDRGSNPEFFKTYKGERENTRTVGTLPIRSRTSSVHELLL